MTKLLLPTLLVLLSACAKPFAPANPSRQSSTGSPTHSSPTSSTKSFVAEAFTVPLTDDGAIPRMVDVRVTSFERAVANGEESLRAVIAWTGRGAGTFAIEGPAGTMIGTGVILPGQRVWFRDVADEKPLSDLMSRGLVFDEVEPAALKSATLRWLNAVVAPAIEEHLRAPVARP